MSSQAHPDWVADLDPSDRLLYETLAPTVRGEEQKSEDRSWTSTQSVVPVRQASRSPYPPLPSSNTADSWDGKLADSSNRREQGGGYQGTPQLVESQHGSYAHEGYQPQDPVFYGTSSPIYGQQYNGPRYTQGSVLDNQTHSSSSAPFVISNLQNQDSGISFPFANLHQPLVQNSEVEAQRPSGNLRSSSDNRSFLHGDAAAMHRTVNLQIRPGTCPQPVRWPNTFVSRCERRIPRDEQYCGEEGHSDENKNVYLPKTFLRPKTGQPQPIWREGYPKNWRTSAK